jgi:cell division protein FtsW (lipid II flippase)
MAFAFFVLSLLISICVVVPAIVMSVVGGVKMSWWALLVCVAGVGVGIAIAASTSRYEMASTPVFVGTLLFANTVFGQRVERIKR